MNEEGNKFLSRKFLVWLVATIILIFAMISNNNEFLKDYVQYWGWISVLYIGGNVAQDFAEGKKCD